MSETLTQQLLLRFKENRTTCQLTHFPTNAPNYPPNGGWVNSEKEGALFHSQDLEHYLVLLTGFLLLTWTWQNLFNDMKYVLTRSFTMIGEVGGGRLEVNDLTNGFIRLLFLLLPDILLMTRVRRRQWQGWQFSFKLSGTSVQNGSNLIGVSLIQLLD